MSMDEVRNLVKAGRTLEAIRAYRDQTGAGLDDALAVVDGSNGNWSPTKGCSPRPTGA